MQFLNPSVLWGLALISIPILIHLFNFQRLKRVAFTNVRWLEEIKVSSSKTKNLKHILILISRILALTMLVLAFAQPILPPTRGRQDPGNWDRVYVLDNSYSMEIADGNENGLTKARNRIEEIENRTDFNGPRFYIDFDFYPKDEYPYDNNSLLDRLTDLEFSLKKRNGEEIFEKSAKVSGARKEIWILSDFQRNTFDDREDWQIDSLNEYFLLPVQSQGHLNFFIDSVWLERPFIEMGNPFKLNGIVKASGGSEGSDIVIRLVVGGEQRASKNIVLEGEMAHVFSFELSLEDQKDFKCLIELEDAGVSIDNSFRFVLSPLGGIRITELGNRPNSFIQALFQSEPAFDHRFLLYNNPDLSRIGSSDLLIIHDNPSFDGLPANILDDYISSGGQVLIVPDPDSASNGVHRFLARQGFVMNRIQGETDPIGISPLSEGDPFFEGVFEELDRRMDLPNVVPKWKTGGWDRAILKLKNEDAFLAYSERKNGRIYLFSSPLVEGFGNFVKHSLFVPVLFRIGAFAQANSSQSLFHRFDRSFFRTRVQNVGPNDLITLKNRGQSIIPRQRLSGKDLLLSVEDVNIKPGFYDLVLDDSIVGSLALNPSSRESILDFISAEELRTDLESFENVTVFDEAATLRASTTYAREHVGRSLWKYCLIFALVFLLAETLILRYL